MDLVEEHAVQRDVGPAQGPRDTRTTSPHSYSPGRRRDSLIGGRRALGHLLGRVKDPAVAQLSWAPGRRALHKADQRSTRGTTGLGRGRVAAADDQTAFAIQEALAGRWATTPADHTTRAPGVPGVRLRCYPDVRQNLNP
uniref:DUF6207 family protein n=1 Tax=Streptomyces hawaiiensis TaxID=67305 RepID=UPI0031E020A1